MAFRHAIGLNEKYLQAYLHLGLALSTRQEFGEAREIYEKAIRIENDNPHLWTAYAYCLADLRKDQEALEAFLRAIKLDKGGQCAISATLGAIALWRRCGNESLARSLYEKIETANPEIVEILKKQKQDRLRNATQGGKITLDKTVLGKSYGELVAWDGVVNNGNVLVHTEGQTEYVVVASESVTIPSQGTRVRVTGFLVEAIDESLFSGDEKTKTTALRLENLKIVEVEK